jgi:hypothetical protein
LLLVVLTALVAPGCTHYRVRPGEVVAVFEDATAFLKNT